jgi:hypothetical protein
MNWRNLITLCKFAILILYCSNWNLSIHAFSQGLAILNAMDVHVTSPSRRTSAVKITPSHRSILLVPPKALNFCVHKLICTLSLGVSKKTKKLIKSRKQKKITGKKNRLEKLKNKPVRFGFGFKRLKPNKPNRFK